MVNIVNVKTAKPYNVYISHGGLETLGNIIAGIKGINKVAIISDSNVAPLYLKKCTDSIESEGFTVYSHVFTAGEKHKNIHTLSNILEGCASIELTRNDCLVALGGGVVGDITGFAAGCYLRGIKFVQVPTTLLAMVDSSVGGKTAIDLEAGKNLAGLFYQPEAVVCDVDCLNTLPKEEYTSGMAEAIKTAILLGDKPFSKYENGLKSEDLLSAIEACVKYKAGVVERDEREQGERKLLNLGHTLGHAIEKCSNFTIPHGNAVAIGIALIAKASYRKAWAKLETVKAILKALENNNLPTSTTYTQKELYNAALVDKKRADNHITLVIPSKIGACELKNVALDEFANIISLALEE